jgi:hypothetical protein
MTRRTWILLAFAALFVAFLALGYLYPVAAPEGWFGQRTEEKVRDR